MGRRTLGVVISDLQLQSSGRALTALSVIPKGYGLPGTLSNKYLEYKEWLRF